MNYTTLNHSDIRISTLALGCFAFAGGQTWGDQDEQDTVRTIECALEHGITFFDTAEGYGAGYSEEVLGRVLAGKRDQVVIATKVSPQNLRPSDLEAACVASLERLQTDYIDLYQIHWPNHDVPLAESVGKLEELKAKGMIRTIGISNFGERDFGELLELSTPVINQLPYNLLFRVIEHDIIPLAEKHKVGILPYSPIMQGLLTGKFTSADDVPEGRARTRHFTGSRPKAQHGEAGFEAETFQAIRQLDELATRMGVALTHLALAWVLHQTPVTAVLVGARTIEQLEHNIQAANLKLPTDVLQELDAITAPLKEGLGTNPDMWNNVQNSRYR
ncbi:MAG: aldo/keto reductase [Deinococcota bacterium]